MLIDLRTHQPSLEDVYLKVTGEDEYLPEGRPQLQEAS